LHLVSVWAVENHLILGQEAVADGSHEIAAIPKLLRVLDLKGALVTIDAASCQAEIARQIPAQQGHYLLAVNGNHPGLQAAVHAVFERACATDFAGVRHQGHAQVEDGARQSLHSPAGPATGSAALRQATAPDRTCTTSCSRPLPSAGGTLSGHRCPVARPPARTKLSLSSGKSSGPSGVRRTSSNGIGKRSSNSRRRLCAGKRAD
jgi:predicted transposase YbfD/YdcC